MSSPRSDPPAARGTYVVAVILSVGICTALNLLVGAVVWDAVYSSQSGISENATQILTGWGGGLLGVIGAIVGYSVGESRGRSTQDSTRTMTRLPNE